MSAGFLFPLGLFLLVPLAWLTWHVWRKEEKSFFIHPWADHLRARLGNGHARSHMPLAWFLAAAAAMIVVIAQPWYGRSVSKVVEKGRYVTFYLDVSSSTDGATRKAEVKVAQQLMKRRKDDLINIIFFSSETLPTSFGYPTTFLSDTVVERIARKIQDGTNATIALFQGFVSIVREEELFDEKDILELHYRTIMESQAGVSLEDRRKILLGYLQSLTEQKPVPQADRLGIFISDCQLGYSHYDLQSVMSLHEALGMRHDVICIGSADIEGTGYRSNQEFVDTVRKSGGKIYPIPTVTADSVDRVLDEVVQRIDAAKPRDVMTMTHVDKRPVAIWFFAAALVFSFVGFMTTIIMGVRN